MPTLKKINPATARRVMRDNGYSYRSAAKLLGVNFSHLHRVLNTNRPSQVLLRKVMEMPKRKGGEA